jgi:flagellar protein FlgJ
MQIDEGLLQYNNQSLRVPSSAAKVASQGRGAAAKASGSAHGSAAIDRKSKLYEQCEEFESIFLKMMIKEMRHSVDKSNSMFSGGWAEDIYTDMLDDEYSKSMAKNAGFDLADQLYRQLAQA